MYYSSFLTTLNCNTKFSWRRPASFTASFLSFTAFLKCHLRKLLHFGFFFADGVSQAQCIPYVSGTFLFSIFLIASNFGFIFDVFLKFCDINLAYLEQLVAIMISRKFGGVYQIRFISFYFIWREFLEPWEFFENKLKLIQLGTTVLFVFREFLDWEFKDWHKFQDF